MQIKECPHCHVRVLPMANNICPACRNDMSNTSDIDPDFVSLIVGENDDLPPYCYSCNRYAESYVRVESETGPPWVKIVSFLAPRQSSSRPYNRGNDETSKVIIYLP